MLEQTFLNKLKKRLKTLFTSLFLVASVLGFAFLFAENHPIERGVAGEEYTAKELLSTLSGSIHVQVEEVTSERVIYVVESVAFIYLSILIAILLFFCCVSILTIFEDLRKVDEPPPLNLCDKYWMPRLALSSYGIYIVLIWQLSNFRSQMTIKYLFDEATLSQAIYYNLPLSILIVVSGILVLIASIVESAVKEHLEEQGTHK